jgi:hypothetical protein
LALWEAQLDQPPDRLRPAERFLLLDDPRVDRGDPLPEPKNPYKVANARTQLEKKG